MLHRRGALFSILGAATSILSHPAAAKSDTPRAPNPWKFGVWKSGRTPNGHGFEYTFHASWVCMPICPVMAWRTTVNGGRVGNIFIMSDDEDMWSERYVNMAASSIDGAIRGDKYDKLRSIHAA